MIYLSIFYSVDWQRGFLHLYLLNYLDLIGLSFPYGDGFMLRRHRAGYFNRTCINMI